MTIVVKRGANFYRVNETRQKETAWIEWHFISRVIIWSILLSLCFGKSEAKVSDQRLCYDPQCFEVVSHGKTVLPYPSIDPDVLSFPANEEVKVFSKPAGDRLDLWGVEIKGKRGYAPSRFIREYKILHKNDDLKYTVPTKNNEHFQSNNQQTEKQIQSDNDISYNIEEDKSKVQEDEKGNTFENDGFPAEVQPIISIKEVSPHSSNEDSTPTQNLADESDGEEHVQLHVYPRILQSTLSAISGILGSGSGEESDSEESMEVSNGVEFFNANSNENAPKEQKVDTSNFDEKESQKLQQEKNFDTITEALGEVTGYVKETKGTLQNKGEKEEKNIESDIKVEDIPTPESAVTKKEEKDIELNNTFQDTATSESAVTAKEGKNVELGIKVEDIPTPESGVTEKEGKNVNLDITFENTATTESANTQKEEKNIELDIKVENTVTSDGSVTEKEEKNIELDIKLEDSTTSESAGTESITENNIPQTKVDEIPEPENANDKVEDFENANKQPDALYSEKSEDKDIEKIDNSHQNLSISDNLKFGVKDQPDNENLANNHDVDASTDVKDQDEKVNTGNEEMGKESEPNDTVFNYIPVVEEKILIAEDILKNEPIADVIINNDNNKIPEQNHLTVNTDVSKDTNESSANFSITASKEHKLKVPLEQEVLKNETADTFIETSQKSDQTENAFSENKINEVQNFTESKTWPDEPILVAIQDTPNVEYINRSNTADDIAELKLNDSINLFNDSVNEDSEPSSQSTESSNEINFNIPPPPKSWGTIGNRNLLQSDVESEEITNDKSVVNESFIVPSSVHDEIIESEPMEGINQAKIEDSVTSSVETLVIPTETCDSTMECSAEDTHNQYFAEENAVTSERIISETSKSFLYVCLTAVTVLLFSLGYYFIENKRRDAFLIAKINNLERDLMVTKKECIMLESKLNSMENENVPNEMVLSLKAELTESENNRAELKEQIASLEKELESTSEAGLELEKMLREILSSQSEENNPLAQSIEKLQLRLNDQQIANETLNNSLALKTQENENLTEKLTASLKKSEDLEIKFVKLVEEFNIQKNASAQLDEKLSEQIQWLENQVKVLNDEKAKLGKLLRKKELELKELTIIVEQLNSNTGAFEKLSEASQIRAEAAHLEEERKELVAKLNEEEGARHLLEEHMRLITEEVSILSEQCKASEKEKKDAETRLEVLTKFFEEKEAQRQRDEALWLEKQGEHISTVEKIQTMQNELQNYKQQVEMLKREILDQEREYKNQISTLETKAHEHWVTARQNERRLEEIKAESSQLRNRLTLVEKNMNDADPDTKIHRLQQNGESGAMDVSSPLMFGGPGGAGAPPLPPFLPAGFAPPPPFLPPPDLSPRSRPTPLGGGRLSSPPPPPNAPNSTMSPPPLSPPLVPMHHLPMPMPHPHFRPPPLPMFDVPPPPPPTLQTHHPHHSWEDDSRKSAAGGAFHRTRNHKGSLNSSGESLDKPHHGGKV